MTPAPERPGATGYWIAGCLPVAVGVVSVTLFVILVLTGLNELGAIQGPDGRVTLQVPEAGEYTCFAEGTNFQPRRQDFNDLSIEATATPGGSITVSRPQGEFSYSFPPREGVAIRTIRFPGPGSYTLQTTWPGDPPDDTVVTRLVFAQYNVAAFAVALLGGCCGTSITIVIALILAFVTYKRRADWDTRYGFGATGRPGAVADAWNAPAGNAPPPAEPPDPYRPPLDQPPPDDEDRLY